MLDFDEYGFDAELVHSLNDIDCIPTTEPDAVKGIPGRLFIVAPRQIEQLDFIIKTLDSIPPSKFARMNDTEKMQISSLLNNAIRVRKNSISR